MEVVIIVICVIIVAALAAAVIYKAITMAKRMRQYKREIKEIQESDKYLLDIVQNGKTVRIECKDVNSDNVELVRKDEKGG